MPTITKGSYGSNLVVIVVFILLGLSTAEYRSHFLFAGNYSNIPIGNGGEGGSALSAVLCGPSAAFLDSSSALFIADESSILRVDSSGVLNSVFGAGYPESTEDDEGYVLWNDGAATSMSASVDSIQADTAGNLYFTTNQRTTSNRLAKITDGFVTAIAGNGWTARNGCPEGCAATSCALGLTTDASPDALGDVYITSGHLIRKVITSQGKIYTTAGSYGMDSPLGDSLSKYAKDEPATAALLHDTFRLTFDTVGRLYVTSSLGESIRRIDLTSGMVSWVAGNGVVGAASGDGGSVTSAVLGPYPSIALNVNGDAYVSVSKDDQKGAYVRKIDPLTGTITQFFGGGHVMGAAAEKSTHATAVRMRTILGLHLQNHTLVVPLSYEYAVRGVRLI